MDRALVTTEVSPASILKVTVLGFVLFSAQQWRMKSGHRFVFANLESPVLWKHFAVGQSIRRVPENVSFHWVA